MDVLFDRVAGLDVGKKIVVVCVRTPGPGGKRVSQIRTFRTMTRSLGLMADWLVECGVQLAAMESTATYWKPSRTSNYSKRRSSSQGERTLAVGVADCHTRASGPKVRPSGQSDGEVR